MTAGKNKLTLAVFSLTLFISASLMFGLQPMIGKMLLPLVGGTPAGWIVAMAFFQLMLLAGYFLAHALARLTAMRHALFFLIVLGIGAVFLPVYLPISLEGTTTPGPLDIFKLLTLTVGLPFLAISATSTTLQRLFTTTEHPDAADPYFLYVASNLGSFAGLLLYPLVVEPLLPLSAQSHYWMWGYAALVTLSFGCLLLSGKKAEPAAVSDANAPPVDTRLKLKWVLQAFIPSALMLAVTTHLTTDVFSAPMMWVLPLAIYLLTFVVAFSRKKFLNPDHIAQFQPIAVAVTLGIMFMCRSSIAAVSWYAVLLHLVVFGATALMCHSYLARLRPTAHPQHLTTFYLMLAIGGALGGILNAFVIPFTLDAMIEYPVLLILSLLANPKFFEKKSGSMPLKIIIGLAILLIVIIGILGILPLSLTARLDTAIMVTTAIVICGIAFLSLNIRAAFACAVVMFIATQFLVPHKTIYQDRNFYGFIRVADFQVKVNGEPVMERIVRHGSTKHGSQIQSPKYEKTMTTYYTVNSPPSQFIGVYNPKDIAVVGLGSGTLNCYSTPENAFTFIDIDAHMIEVAQKYFTYLEKCQGRRPPRLLTGDGRLELARMKDEKFDLIILDAFSSDAIPVHLLTTDAINIYLSRLNNLGILAFHVSNRYFNLVPVLAKNAAVLDLQVYAKLRIPPRGALENPSLWVLMARRDLNLVAMMDMGWMSIPPLKSVKPWTDDDNNLMSALMMLNNQKEDYAQASGH